MEMYSTNRGSFCLTFNQWFFCWNYAILDTEECKRRIVLVYLQEGKNHEKQLLQAVLNKSCKQIYRRQPHRKWDVSIMLLLSFIETANLDGGLPENLLQHYIIKNLLKTSRRGCFQTTFSHNWVLKTFFSFYLINHRYIKDRLICHVCGLIKCK